MSSPYELRGFTGEDYSIVNTVAGSGSLSGTFVLELFDPDGDEITDGVSCSITSAGGRVVTGVISGADLDPGVYRWSIRRTDTGSRVVSAWGTLVIRDPQVN